MKICFNRHLVVALIVGQILALCLTGTDVFTKLLADRAIPAAQTFLNYFFLSIVYFSYFLYKRGFSGFVDTLYKRDFILAVFDVEGNYFVVKAFSMTSVLSAILLASLTTPMVVLLSLFVLKTRYMLIHYVGILLCLFGLGLLVYSDILVGDIDPNAPDSLLGDVYVLIGACFYAVANVMQEMRTRTDEIWEIIAMMSVFSVVISGIQLLVLERDVLIALNVDISLIGYLAGYLIAMFCFYSIVPWYIKFTSATAFNISILTSDFYTLIISLFIFNPKLHALYPAAFCLIVFGQFIFNLNEPITRKSELLELPISEDETRPLK